MPEHFQISNFLSHVLIDGVLVLGLSSYVNVRLSALAGTGSALCKSSEPSWIMVTSLPAPARASGWIFNTSLFATFPETFPMGKNNGNYTLEANVGKYLWISSPQKSFFWWYFCSELYWTKKSEAAPYCPVSSKLVLHQERKASEFVRKCTIWIKPAKIVHGAFEDRGILCLVTDNSWTKRNWLALITACLPSGCCRASCSKAPSRIWQVAANES